MIDASGAVVVGADVTASNTATGISTQTKTNAAGVYTFSALRPGEYHVSVRASGFKQAVQSNLELHVQDRAKQDFALQVGSTDQTIQVTAEAPLVNGESATVGTVVDQQFVSNMPLNGRSIQSLISLTPSVVITPVTSASPGQFSMNGQRPDANYFTVDGVSANVSVGAGAAPLAGASGSGVQPSASGGFSNLASVDSIQEFKVQTSTFAPEFGRTPGGQVSIVTKTGTNRLHGDVFEYLRNNVFDANDWFLNATPARTGVPQHPAERQNDFGFTLGGPIWKNKAFFFGSYEGARLTTPKPLLKYVPSLCARGAGPCPSGTTAAVAAVRPYLNAYPLPTVGGCGTALAASADPLLSPFCVGYTARTNADNSSIRGDYNITSKWRMFARWAHSPSTSSDRGAPAVATSIFVTEPNWTSWTAGTTYAMTSTLLDDFRFNFSQAKGDAHSVLDAFAGATPIPDTDPVIFPKIALPDGTQLTPDKTRFFITYTPAVAWRDGLETNNEADQWNYVDTLSWIRGTHQMKFGIDFRRLTPILGRAPYQQSYTFQTTAQMNTGKPFSYLVQFNPLAIGLYHQLSLYGQDTWKVTPRVTLTYGLRWEYNPAPGTLNNVPFLGLNQLDFNNLAATTVAPLGTPIYHDEFNAFAPRIGMAYQLSTDPRWGRVLRAGWGMFFDTTGDYSVLSVAAQPGMTFSATTPSSQCGPAVFPATACQQDPRNVKPNPNQPPWSNVAAQSPDLRLPVTHQMNVALEQSLGAMQSLTLTYAGAVGRKLFVVETFATPRGTSNFDASGFSAITNEASSDYHSLQALFQRRLSHGLQAMASYTWSHSIDTGSNANFTIPNRLVEPISRERGNSDFDLRHSFQAAVSYDIPGWQKNPVLHALLSHWGTDYIFRARTAPPVNITNSTVTWAEFPGKSIAKRPDVVADQPFYLYGDACAAFYKVAYCPGGMGINKAAFVAHSGAAGAGQGSLGRNQLRGFPWEELDMTIRRQFPIHESVNLQFRADIFNVLNTPGFFLNNTNLSVGSFGLSSSMLSNSLFQSGTVSGFNSLYQIGGPRSIQLSLKLVF